MPENRHSDACALTERGTTFYVGGDGPGNYTHIQDAVDNASIGNTVVVFNGTYLENVIIDKTLILTGENQNGTIIDGNGMGDVVTISAEYVSFSGFTIQNSGEQGTGAGITVLANNVTIQDCISQNNTYYGIYVMNCTGATIVNCTVFNNHFSGITLENSSNNNIVGCVSYGHQGIILSLPAFPYRDRVKGNQKGVPLDETIQPIYGYVYYDNVNIPVVNGKVTARDDNTSINHSDLTDVNGKYEITFANFISTEYSDEDHLTIWANGTGIFSGWKGITEDLIDVSQTPQFIGNITLQWTYGTGIFVINATNNTLLGCSGENNSIAIGVYNAWGNLFSQCQSYNNTQGIHLFLSQGNTVTECSLQGNEYGLVLAQNSTDNTVITNQIYNNTYGINISNSGDNLVYNNVFMNAINAIDDSVNQWNISKTVGDNIVDGTYLGGNFWDDYLGGDNDGDGLGDTYLPYNCSEKIQNGGDFLPLTSPNLMPTARDDYYNIPEDSINIILDPLANDTDPENDTLTITTITPPLHGTATHNTTHITYTPTPNYYGNDTITYTITDGNTTDTATIHITITNINDPPTAQDDYYVIPEDSINIILDPLSNDSDLDNETVNIFSIIQPLHGSATHNTTHITYTPTPNYYGNDTITYTITDGNTTDTATIHITITNINDPPIAQNDYLTIPQNSIDISINPLENDIDPENDNLSIISIVQPSHGTASNNHTHVTYTPNLDYYGNDTIVYTITDGIDTDKGYIYITITPTPTARDDYYNIPEDSINIILDPLANDTDPENDTLTITTITPPLHGTATHNTTHITYTPTPNYYGNDTITYTITDGNTTDTATIHITITNINDPPTANFTFAPENPSTEDVIQFTDTSTDIDGEEINTWLWDFGDGNTSNIQNPTHQYGMATIYQVTLTIWDTEGASDTITKNISAIIPTIDYILITHKSHNEINDDNISTRFTLIFYASGFNTTLGYVGSVDANWSISITNGNASLNRTMGATVFFDAGWHNGTATVSADDGNGHSDTVELTINSSLFSTMFYRNWNLVTVPFVNEWTAETLGENITGCITVVRFDASTQLFFTHVVGIPHDDFSIMDGVGYFMYCTQDSILSMPDISITSVNIPIYENWNIVGWYHDYSTTAESLGQNIIGTYVVTMFDAQTQVFLTHVVGTPHDNFYIERGMGLFVYTSQASMWQGE